MSTLAKNKANDPGILKWFPWNKTPAVSTGSIESSTLFRRRLATGILGWLRFEFSCNRGHLLEEKSLIHPIAQIVTSRLAHVTVYSEVRHPALTSTRNCPKLDFVAFVGSTPVVAIETKYVGWNTVSVPKIEHDLEKLEVFENTTKAMALLILVGLEKHVDKSLHGKEQLKSLASKTGGYWKSSSCLAQARIYGPVERFDKNDVKLKTMIWEVRSRR
jgi:hypothetical protein